MTAFFSSMSVMDAKSVAAEEERATVIADTVGEAEGEAVGVRDGDLSTGMCRCGVANEDEFGSD